MIDDGTATRHAGRTDTTSPAVPDLPPEAPPSPLETRYRRLLRILPSAYRAAREEEMVAAFLAAARDRDPDNWDLSQKLDGPDWAEKRSVVALALGLRWGRSVAPQRYEVRLGAVRVALFGYLVMAAGMSVVSIVAWMATARWPIEDTAIPAQQLPVSEPARLWIAVSTWAFVVWIPALCCALHGSRAGMRWAAGLATLPAVVAVITAATAPTPASWIVTAIVDLAVVVALAALAGARPSLAVPHARGWLVAAGALVAADAGLSTLLIAGSPSGWWPPSGTGREVLVVAGWLQVDDIGAWCWAVLVAAVVLLVRALRGRPSDTASLLGLALFAGAVAVVRAGDAEWAVAALASPQSDLLRGYVVAIAVQLAVTATICVTSACLAAQRLRRLPAARYAAGRRI